MAQRNTVEITINATDKASAVLDQVSKSTKTLGKVALAGLAGGAIAATGAIVALGAGIANMTLEAAQIEGVTSTFEQLAQSIGSEAEPAMQLMREATRGMVADADLMQAGNKFMAMGLATTQEEMGKLSVIATQLGSAMGEGPTESMENFALMLANQSIPRLDSFGISSGKVRERITELMEATEGLTREEAFMTAVMEQAEVTMGKVGEQGDTTAASMARIDASMQNTALGIGKSFIPALQGILKPIADLVERLGPMLVEWAGKAAEVLGPILTRTVEKLTGAFETIINIVMAFLSSDPGDFPWEDVFPPQLADTMYKVSEIIVQLRKTISAFFGELQTGHGVMSAMKEALWTFLPDALVDQIFNVVDAVSGFISTIVDGITQFVSWKDVLIAVGIGIASVLVPAVIGLVATLAPLIAGVAALVGAIALLRKAWESDFLGMRTKLLELWAAAGPVIESIITWFQVAIPKAVAFARSTFELLASLWQSTIQPALTELGKAFAELWAALVEAWNTIKPIFAELGKAIGEAFGGGGGKVLEFAAVVKVAVDVVVFAIKALAKVVTVVAKIIGIVFKTLAKLWDKYGYIIIKVVKLIGKVFKDVVKIIKKLVKGDFKGAWLLARKLIEKINKKIGKVIRAAWKAIIKFIKRKLAEIIRDVIEFGKEMVKKFIELLGNVIKKVIDWGVDLIKKIVQILGDVIKKVIEFGKEMVKKFIELLGNVIKKVIDWGVDLIKKFVEILGDVIKKVIDWGVDLIKKFVEILGDVIKKVVDWGIDLIKKFAEILGDVIQSVIDWGVDLIKKFAEILGDVIQSVIDWGVDLIKKFAEILGDVVQEVIDWGTDFLDKFGNVLADVIQAVISWGVELYNTFRDVLLDLANIPAEIADTLRQIGTDIINSVIEGIQEVSDFVDKVVAQLTTWFEDVYARILTGFQAAVDIGKLIVLRIKEAIEDVSTFVGDIEKQLSDWFSALTTTATDWFSKVVEIGKEFVEQLKQGISDSWSDFVTWLTEKFDIDWPWNSPDEIGREWVKQFIKGLDEDAHLIDEAIRAAVGGVSAMSMAPLGINAGLAGMGIGTGGGLAAAGNTTNMGGITLAPVINTPIDEEEFYFRVEEALRRSTS